MITGIFERLGAIPMRKIIFLALLFLVGATSAWAALENLPSYPVISQADVRPTTDGYQGYLFAPNLAQNEIKVYRSSDLSYVWRYTSTELAGAPYGIAVDPRVVERTYGDSNRAYVAVTTRDGGKIQVFEAYNADFDYHSDLSLMLDVNAQTRQIAIAPNGKFLYVADATGRVFKVSIDESHNGQLALIGAPTNVISSYYGSPYGLAVSPDSRYLAVTCMKDDGTGTVLIYNINTDDGSLTRTIAPITNANLDYPTQIQFSNDGTKLFVKVHALGTADVLVFKTRAYTDAPFIIDLATASDTSGNNFWEGMSLAANDSFIYLTKFLVDRPTVDSIPGAQINRVNAIAMSLKTDAGDWDLQNNANNNKWAMTYAAQASDKDGIAATPDGTKVFLTYSKVDALPLQAANTGFEENGNAVPLAPSNLRLNSSTSLAWDASVDDGEMTEDITYSVQYKNGADSAWGDQNYLGDDDYTNTRVSLAPLDAADDYYFRVKAFDGATPADTAGHYSPWTTIGPVTVEQQTPRIDHIEYRANPTQDWTSDNNPSITYTVAIVGEGFGQPAADQRDGSAYNINIDGRRVRGVVPNGGFANNGGQIYSWTPSRIEFLLPPVMRNTSRLEPGEFSINVTAFGITDTDSKTLRVRPFVSRIDPNNGPTRNEIVVYGYGFGPTQESLGVNFTGTDNRLPATVLEWALGAQGGVDQAKVRVPLNAITGMVRVRVANLDSNEDNEDVIYTVEPAVITSTSVDRDTDYSFYDGNGDGVADEDPNPAADFAGRTWGYASSSIMVNGHDFGTDPGPNNRDNLFSNVKFNAITIPASNVWSWTDGVIEVGIPRRVQNADNSYTYLDPAAYNITVTRGTASNNRSFTIYPKIDRVVVGGNTYLTQQIAQGYAGSQVEIYGYGFGAAKSDFEVRFDSIAISSDDIHYLRGQFEDRIILTTPANLTVDRTYTITIRVNNLSNNGQTIRYAVQAIGAPQISADANFGAVEKSAKGIDPQDLDSQDLDPMNPAHWIALGDGANVYQSVRVNGSNFDPLGTGAKAIVKVGNTTLTSDQVYSTTNTYVIFGTPPGVYPNYTTSSNHTLTVTAPGGSAVNTLSVAPYIDNVPAEADLGDTIRIYGTALNGAAGTSKSVTVGGVAALSVTYGQASDTQYLELIIPVNSALVGLNKAIIATVDGHKSNTVTINITSNEPIIEQTRVKLQSQGDGWGDDVSTVQNWAYLNDMVRIEGDNFGAAAGTLKVGGVTVTPISWADTHIDFTVPRDSKLGDADISVTAGGITVVHDFEVRPYLSEINPTSGHRGDTITLSGFFTGNAAVTVNFETMPFSASSVYDTDIDLITMAVPQTIIDGRWLVSVSVGGVKSNELQFTVSSFTPQISNILVKEQGEGASWDPAINNKVVDKDWGYYNDWVRIEGSNFGAAEGTIRLYDTNVNAADVYWANDHIDFKIPRQQVNPAATIYVTSTDGRTESMPFTVKPFIKTVTPAAGAAGSIVTLTGYFGASSPLNTLVGVYVNDAIVGTYSVATYGQFEDTLTFSIPAGMTTGAKTIKVVSPYTANYTNYQSNGVAFTVDPLTTSVEVKHGTGSYRAQTWAYVYDTVKVTTNAGLGQNEGQVKLTNIVVPDNQVEWNNGYVEFWIPRENQGQYVDPRQYNINLLTTDGRTITATIDIQPWIFEPTQQDPSGGLSASEGYVGQQMTIDGTSFGEAGTATVKFISPLANPPLVDAPATITRLDNSDRVTLSVPEGLQTGLTYQTNVALANGRKSNTLNIFKVVAHTPPSISGVYVRHLSSAAPYINETAKPYGYVYDSVKLVLANLKTSGTVQLSLPAQGVNNAAVTAQKWDTASGEIIFDIPRDLGTAVVEAALNDSTNNLTITVLPQGESPITQTMQIRPRLWDPTAPATYLEGRQGEQAVLGGIGLGNGRPWDVQITPQAGGLVTPVTGQLSARDASGNETLTVNIPQTIATGSYNIKINSPVLGNSEPLQIYQGDLPPTAFNLSKPDDDPTGVSPVSCLPQFIWGPSYDPEARSVSYTLEIDTNSNFSTAGHLSAAVGTPTSYTLSSTQMLRENTSYFWRVTASDGTRTTKCTADFTFTTGTSITPDNRVIDDLEGAYVNPTTGYYELPAANDIVITRENTGAYEGGYLMSISGARLQSASEGNDGWGGYLNTTTSLSGYDAVSFRIKSERDILLTFKLQDNNNRISKSQSLRVKGSTAWQEKTVCLSTLTADGVAPPADIRAVRQYQLVYDGPESVQVKPIKFDLVQGTLNTPPADFALISPAIGAVFGAVTSVDCVWGQSADSDGLARYTLVYANNSAFTGAQYADTSSLVTTAKATGLSFGTWYWKVIATDNRGLEKVSATGNFKIENAPGAFDIISPKDANTSQLPTFVWQPSVDPDAGDQVSYTVYISTASDPVTKPTRTYQVAANGDTQLPMANVDPANPLPTGTKYWTVVAKDLSGVTRQATSTGVFYVQTGTTPGDIIIDNFEGGYVDFSGSSIPLDGQNYHLWLDSDQDNVADPTDPSGAILHSGFEGLHNLSLTARKQYDGFGGILKYARDLSAYNAVSFRVLADAGEDVFVTFQLQDPGHGSAQQFATVRVIGDGAWQQKTVSILQPNGSQYDGLAYSNVKQYGVSVANAAGELPRTFYLDYVVGTMHSNPAAPVLRSPANSVPIGSTSPVVFDWEDVAGTGIKYTLAYSTTSDFAAGTVTYADNLTSSGYKAALAVDDYWWKVTAIDSVGAENTSGTWQFTVHQNSAPNAFDMLEPTYNKPDVTTLPTFRWEQAVDVDNDLVNYEVRVGTSSNLQSADTMVITSIDGQPIKEPQFQWAETGRPALTPNTLYYWRVKATDEHGAEKYATTVYFKFTTGTSIVVGDKVIDDFEGSYVEDPRPLPSIVDSIPDVDKYYIWGPISAARQEEETVQVEPGKRDMLLITKADAASKGFGGELKIAKDLGKYNAISFWMYNATGADDDIQFQLKDVDGSSYSTRNIRLEGRGSWTQKTVRLSDINVRSLLEPGLEEGLNTSDIRNYNIAYQGNRARSLVVDYIVATNHDGPAAPVLVSPDVDAPIPAGSAVNFDWKTSDGASWYNLVYAKDQNFTTDVQYVWRLSDTQYSLNSLADGQYWWKVIATDGVGMDTESEVRKFTVGGVINHAPGAFTQTRPAALATNVSTQPRFEWSRSVDADTADTVTYNVRVVQDGDNFVDGPFLVNETTTDTSLSMAERNLLALVVGDYQWRVTASDTKAVTTATNAEILFTVGTNTTPDDAIIDNFEGSYVSYPYLMEDPFPASGRNYYNWSSTAACIQDQESHEGNLAVQGTENVQYGGFGGVLQTPKNLTNYDAITFWVMADNDLQMTTQLKDTKDNGTNYSHTSGQLRVKKGDWQQVTVDLAELSKVTIDGKDHNLDKTNVTGYGFGVSNSNTPQNFYVDYVTATKHTALGSFSLTAPTSGQPIPSVQGGTLVNFTWAAPSNGAMNYTLAYSTTSDFQPASTIYRDGILTNSRQETLADGTYYWKVIAFDALGAQRVSTETNWQFTITPPAGTPVITGIDVDTNPDPLTSTWAPTTEAFIYDHIKINGDNFGVDPGNGNRDTITNNVKVEGTMIADVVASGEMQVYSWSDEAIEIGIPRSPEGNDPTINAMTNAPIVVTVGAKTASSALNIRPRVYSLTPAEARVGEQVDIKGTAFGNVGHEVEIIVTGVAEPVMADVLNREQGADQDGGGGNDIVRFTVPAGAQSGPVVLRSGSQNSNNDVILTIIPPMGAPDIQTVAVKHGSAAYADQLVGYVYDTVKLTGVNFGALEGIVRFAGLTIPNRASGAPIRVYGWSATEITFGIPREIGGIYVEPGNNRNIEIVTSTNLTDSITNFSVAPWIFEQDGVTNFNPLVGENITIQGVTFGNMDAYTITYTGVNGNGSSTGNARRVDVDKDEVSTAVPVTLAQGNYEVRLTHTASGLVSNPVTITVDIPGTPVIREVNPDIGHNAENIYVTVTGSGFVDGAIVSLTRTGLSPVTADNYTYNIQAGTITCQLLTKDREAGKWNVEVANPGNPVAAVMTNGFTITSEQLWGKVIDDFEGNTVVSYSPYGEGNPALNRQTADVYEGSYSGAFTYLDSNGSFRGYFGQLVRGYDLSDYDMVGIVLKGDAATNTENKAVVGLKASINGEYHSFSALNHPLDLNNPATYTDITNIPVADFVEVDDSGVLKVGGLTLAAVANREHITGYQINISGAIVGSVDPGVKFDFIRAYKNGIQPPVVTDAITTSISRTGDVAGNSSVTLSWSFANAASAVNIYAISGSVDAPNGVFTTTAADWSLPVATADINTRTWTDPEPQVGIGTQKYYKVISSASPLTNADLLKDVVGKFDIAMSGEFNLISLPLEVADTNISAVIGTQLQGGIFPPLSDRIYRYKTDGSGYEQAWLNSADNQWYDVDSGNVSTMPVAPDVSYWIQLTAGHTNAVMTIVGKVSESSRQMNVISDFNFVGTTYPIQVGINSSNLRESGATGGIFPPQSIRIYGFKEDQSGFDQVWLNSTDSQWYDVDSGQLSTMNFVPGKGYIFDEVDGISPYTWQYTKPY